MTSHEHKEHLGAAGECICPRCEKRFAHRRGVPCQDERCPDCDAKLLRVCSEHHALWLKKKQG